MRNHRLLRTFILIPFLIILVHQNWAQEPKAENDLYELSLEELLDVRIVTASKKEENIFDSPLSSSVITREEISNSGVTSIAEALRLAPGLIVREYTNGSYDIHIRGLDNAPPNENLDRALNLITLVMIDGRIVFNYLNGGIFWNSLPIDLIDIDRIEIIRGPGAALYGPNAVDGVINIITDNDSGEGFDYKGFFRQGNFNSTMASSSLNYSSDKLNSQISANFQRRNRYDEQYYIYANQQFQKIPESAFSFITGPTDDLMNRYPHPERSQLKYGLNSFIDYVPNANLSIRSSLGYQSSESQILFAENGITPLINNKLQSYYFDSRIQYKNLSLQINNLNGEQNQSGGTVIPFNNFAANIEYEFDCGSLAIRPGLSYNRSKYSWVNISKEELSFVSAFVRSDFQKGDFRVVSALRADSYSQPDDIYLSWQFAAMYKLNEKNLIRTVVSRSNTVPFIAETYFSIDRPFPSQGFGLQFLGNTDLDLTTMDMVEIGYRTKLMESLYLDSDLFFSRTSDFNSIFFEEVRNIDGLQYTISRYQNLDLTVSQTGLTTVLEFIPSNAIRIKLFGTIQNTMLLHFTPDLNDLSNQEDRQHEATPSLFGGFYVHLKPTRKLDFNMNGYYMGESKFNKSDGVIPSSEPVTVILDETVDPFMVFSLNSSYQLSSLLKITLSARNLGSNKNQFAFNESVRPLYLAGIVLNLN